MINFVTSMIKFTTYTILFPNLCDNCTYYSVRKKKKKKKLGETKKFFLNEAREKMKLGTSI